MCVYIYIHRQYMSPITLCFSSQDREIVLAAVTQNGEALSFGKAWQGDEDAVHGAVVEKIDGF